MKRSKGDGSGNWTFQIVCLAVGLMMGMGCLLYLSILMSPGLLRRILHDVLQCTGTESLPHIDGSYTSSDFSEKATVSINGNDVVVRCAPCADHCQGKPGLDSEYVRSDLTASGASRKIKILVGVLTMASKAERRSLLRLAYGLQSSEYAEVKVNFVLGELANDQDKILVGMEKLVHGDIMILDCKENLNSGKTFHFFSKVAEMGVHYDYVMKTDDDSYLRFNNLGKHVSLLPRQDLYYGYILPCENQNPYEWYMAGMGYLISWDLVEWIRDSPIPRNSTTGTEDKLVGDWFNEGGKAKSRVNDKPFFYDHPEFGGKCAHELIPETVLIHQVKTISRWVDVLSYFEKHRISLDAIRA